MKLKILVIAVTVAIFASCGGKNKKAEKSLVKEEVKKEVKVETVAIDPLQDKGVGPITSVTLGEIDPALAEKGHQIFKAKCSACHKISKRYIGPALRGITKKQSPEWIMNMILNPEKMIVENETAKNLLKEYNAPMANQRLTEDEARAILEYFRTKN